MSIVLVVMFAGITVYFVMTIYVLRQVRDEILEAVKSPIAVSNQMRGIQAPATAKGKK